MDDRITATVTVKEPCTFDDIVQMWPYVLHNGIKLMK